MVYKKKYTYHKKTTKCRKKNIHGPYGFAFLLNKCHSQNFNLAEALRISTQNWETPLEVGRLLNQNDDLLPKHTGHDITLYVFKIKKK